MSYRDIQRERYLRYREQREIEEQLEQRHLEEQRLEEQQRLEEEQRLEEQRQREIQLKKQRDYEDFEKRVNAIRYQQNLRQAAEERFLRTIEQDIKCVMETNDPIRIEMCLSDMNHVFKEHPDLTQKYNEQIRETLINIHDYLVYGAVGETISRAGMKRTMNIFHKIAANFDIHYDTIQDYDDFPDTTRDEQLAQQLQDEWNLE